MKISIIVPVYNNEETIKECLRALIDQDYPQKDFEIVVVNDGSTDSTLELIKGKQEEAKEKGIILRIINLEKNKGRVVARETGAKNAKYSNLLFIDSRCIADRNILANIKKINYQPIVGNPIIDWKRSNFDRFNWLLRKKIYFPYWGEEFEPVFITKDNFDNIGKGMGVFFCNKELFLTSQLKSRNRNVSDDTKLLWKIVQKKKILKEPSVKVMYLPRTSLKKGLKHVFQRGPKFVDNYLNPEKKNFWVFIFLPILALCLTSTLIFVNLTCFIYWLGFLGLIWLFLSLWLAENTKDFFIILPFLMLFGLIFELGIFKGLVLKVLKKY